MEGCKDSQLFIPACSLDKAENLTFNFGENGDFKYPVHSYKAISEYFGSSSDPRAVRGCVGKVREVVTSDCDDEIDEESDIDDSVTIVRPAF